MTEQTNRGTEPSLQLNPMQPGEDAPSSRPPENKLAYGKMQERLAEIYADESANQAHTSNHIARDALEIGVLTFVFVGLLIVVGLLDLPWIFSVLATISPAIIAIILRIKKDGMTVTEAVRSCRVHIIYSAFLLVLGCITWLRN